MKKSLLCLLTLVCSMSLFTACNKGDDTGLPIQEEMAGSYKGALAISVSGEELAGGIPQKVFIYKSTNGKEMIKLELKNFSLNGLDLGTIQVDPCTVTKENGGYAFTGSQTLELNPPIGSCPVEIKGKIVGSKISITITVTVALMEQDVVAQFEGTKLAGTESAEAKIKAFTFDSKFVVDQPVIDEASGEITFTVSDAATAADLQALVPTITVSDKATITPNTGVAQDFSDHQEVLYTVVAEDGTTKLYTASVGGNLNVLKYSFETWEPYGDAAELPLPRNQLASSSEGAALLSGYGKGVPVYKSNDKKEGQYAIKLYTLDLSEHANALIPAITSGTIYTGKFNMSQVMIDRMLCTEFGIPYSKNPISLRGWYKYAPGSKFLNGTDPENIIEVLDKTDECSIQAILFQVDNSNEVLTGKDISNSPKIVAIAALADGTAKTEYTEFDLPFTFVNGKSYDANTNYKIAIICSSSKEGDLFRGAGGSTLIVDELQVIGK